MGGLERMLHFKVFARCKPLGKRTHGYTLPYPPTHPLDQPRHGLDALVVDLIPPARQPPPRHLSPEDVLDLHRRRDLLTSQPTSVCFLFDKPVAVSVL